MEKLERSPLDVLESLIQLAESIDADWNRSPAQSRPLAMALAEVRWLHGKSLGLPHRGYIQERLGYLANHLRALVGTRDRAWELRQCRSEIDRLQTQMCFGQLQSLEADSNTPS